MNSGACEVSSDTHTKAGWIKCVTAANGKKTYCKAAGRAAGVAGAVLAVAAAAEGAEEINRAVDDYARHAASGETAMMDLDAIEVAIGVQTMTGNYFVTMDVLGIMLQ
jgi:hypothetical protein